MTEKLTRTFGTDIEVRRTGSQRIVAGYASTFDDPYNIGRDQLEVVRPGAFARTITERGQKLKLLASHDSGRFPLGRATALSEDATGLFAEFRISKTKLGDEALELLADGALDAFSIGFQPIASGFTAEGVRELREVRLIEVSLVAIPANPRALVTATRSSIPLEYDPIVFAARLTLGDI